MRRPFPGLLALLCLLLTGCEALVFGSAAGLALAYYKAKGSKTYSRPYPEVATAATRAAAALCLRGQEIERDEDSLTITGKDANDKSVTITVTAEDKGRKAELTWRFGAMGDTILNRLFFDTLHQELRIPPPHTPS